MRHWRTCSLHTTPPVIVENKQVEARQFKSALSNVQNAVDNMYMSLSTVQHFKTDYPIKLTPFTEDADTLALVSFLEFNNVDYCLFCDEQGIVDAVWTVCSFVPKLYSIDICIVLYFMAYIFLNIE